MSQYEKEMVRITEEGNMMPPANSNEDYCITGIEPLDQKLGGGIPAGNSVLMVGSSGSGKTTFCMQFLANGARNGERGVFFTITEPLFKLTKNMENFQFYDKKDKSFTARGSGENKKFR